MSKVDWKKTFALLHESLSVVKSVKMMIWVKIYRSLVASGRKLLRRGQLALKNSREDRDTVAHDRKSPKRGDRLTSFDCTMLVFVEEITVYLIM